MNYVTTARAGYETADLTGSLKDRAKAAAAVAQEFAASVDAGSRFPAEAIAMIKQQRLMGILVPQELGDAEQPRERCR